MDCIVWPRFFFIIGEPKIYLTIVRIRQINRPRLESFSAGEAIVGQTEMLYVSLHSLGNSSTVDGDSSRALPDSVLLKDKKPRNTSDF